MFTTEAINTADALWSKVEVGTVVLGRASRISMVRVGGKASSLASIAMISPFGGG